MSRLDDECIMAVVRNRSGIDSGEIDYSLMIERFENLSDGCLMDCMDTLGVLAAKCKNLIESRAVRLLKDKK